MDLVLRIKLLFSRSWMKLQTQLFTFIIAAPVLERIIEWLLNKYQINLTSTKTTYKLNNTERKPYLSMLVK